MSAELVAKLEKERLTGMPRWDVTGDTQKRWRDALHAAAVDERLAVDEWLKTGEKKP
jgi:hypothetical protein